MRVSWLRWGWVLGGLICLWGGGHLAFASPAPRPSMDWSGTLPGDTTFWPAANPYIIAADLTVPAGVTLTVVSGVEVQLAPGASLLVYGQLLAAGTPTQPITFTWRDAGQPWGALAILNSPADNRLEYVTLEHAGEEAETTPRYQGVSVRDARLTIAHSELRFIEGRAIHAENADLTLRDSVIHSIHGDALSAGHGSLVVERNLIYDIAWGSHAYEGLSINDMSAAGPALVTDNTIHAISDDCVDINWAVATLARNRLYDCGDKGVSVGALQGQFPNHAALTLVNNLIYSATLGVAVKDGATAHLVNNTIISHTQAALALYEVHMGYGGGRAFVTNTILWGGTAISLGVGSTVSVAFSDVEGGWSGAGNFVAPPDFAADADFRLSETSPCRDAGTLTGAPRDDLDGFPRPIGAAPDVGAYEWPPLRLKAAPRDGALALWWRAAFIPAGAASYAVSVMHVGTLVGNRVVSLPLTLTHFTLLSLTNGVSVTLTVELRDAAGVMLLRSPAVVAVPRRLGVYLPLVRRDVPPSPPPPERVAQVAITLDPDDWAYLDAHRANRELFPATFMADGVTFDAGVRYRGEISRWLPKKSWKVDFDSAALFAGQRELNFNAEYPDKSLMREWLAYDLFARLGLPASRAGFAALHVNGGYRGLFTEVEQVDQRFLYRVGLDPNGNLYKGDYGSFHLVDDPAFYAEQYLKKTNEDEDNRDLVAFIEMLHTVPTTTAPITLAARFDVAAYLDWYAIQIAIGNYEWVEKNFYLYHDLRADRWRVLPWDMDLSFGLNHNGTVLDEHISWDNPIDAGTASSPKNDGAWNYLTTVILDQPDFRFAYCRRLRELLDGAFAPDVMAARIAHAYTLIRAYGEADPYKWGTNAEFATQSATLQAYVTYRRAWLLAQMPAYCPPTGPLPVVNEIQAAPDAWVELYNPGLLAMDLGGMRLADGELRITNYESRIENQESADQRISGSVNLEGVIAPGGILVVRLTGIVTTGGEIVLYDKPLHGGDVLSTLAYPALAPGASFGWLDDGGALTGTLAAPTPGWSNRGRAPVIADVMLTPSIPRGGQPFTVTARIADADGNLLAAWLDYTVATTTFTAPLTPVGEIVTAILPTLADGVVVTYTLHAEDAAGLRSEVTGRCRIGFARPPLYFNELVAINVNGLRDLDSNTDDWLEIYNAGPTPVDMGGMYLSDMAGNPRQWLLPPGVVVPAGGYLILLADDEPDEGPTHLGFKLDGDGERLALYAGSSGYDELIDEVSYPPQAADQAWGRLPDGMWGALARPSPGVENGVGR